MNIPEGLPPHARQVYSGIIFDLWQWEQTLYDGSTAIYESATRADSITVIPIVGDKILVQHQEQPFRGAFISLPGGSREEENPLVDAQRELLDETGYASDTWEMAMTVSPGDGKKLVWRNYVYVAKHCSQVMEARPEPGEKIRVELICFDDFLALTDDPLWRHLDLVSMMLRARYIPEKYNELKNALFG